MTAVRDSLCNLGRMEIPRPKCQGLQFIPTRGRQGFYKSIRVHGEKYGLAIKPQGPRRPMLSNDMFKRPETVKEEDSDGTVSPTLTNVTTRRIQQSDDDRSSHSSNTSESSQRSSPIELAPDYPDDYVPPQFPAPTNKYQHSRQPRHLTNEHSLTKF